MENKKKKITTYLIIGGIALAGIGILGYTLKSRKSNSNHFSQPKMKMNSHTCNKH